MVSFVVAGFVSGTMGFSCFENLACQAEVQFVCALCVCVCVVGVGVLLLDEEQQRSPTHRNHQRPRGPMAKASAHGAGDCRFESCRGHFGIAPGRRSGEGLDANWVASQSMTHRCAPPCVENSAKTVAVAAPLSARVGGARALNSLSTF